jgi:hypothetical protein
LAQVSGRDYTDVRAKAKAIAELKRELAVVFVGLIVAAAVVLIGGSGALSVLRWIVAGLIVVLVIASRVARRHRSPRHEAAPEDKADEVWRLEQERYAEKQRERDRP